MPTGRINSNAGISIFSPLARSNASIDAAAKLRYLKTNSGASTPARPATSSAFFRRGLSAVRPNALASTQVSAVPHRISSAYSARQFM